MSHRIFFILLLNIHLLASLAEGSPTYPSFIVTLKGIPTLALVEDQPTETTPQAKIIQSLFSFEYYYIVQNWNWNPIITQSESKRKPWSVKPPLLSSRNNTLTYTAEVGTFPCAMDIKEQQSGITTLSWEHNLSLGEKDYFERQEIRTSRERGILLKLPSLKQLKDVNFGKPGEKLLISFFYEDEPYRLELSDSHDIKGVSFKQSPPGQLWLAFNLKIGTPELVKISATFTYPAQLPTHLNYERMALHHSQEEWLTCNLQDDSYWLDVGSILLDPPAGKHGFLTVRDGNFYFEKTDTPFFMSGTTYVHSSKFPDKKTAQDFAKRVAAMGFNLVRLHHLDYHVPGFGLFNRLDMKSGKTQQFDNELIDRMDYLIYCLKKLGIYIHLDGITARRFLKNDGVPGSDKISSGMKGSAYILESDILRSRQEQYLSALWNHINPYTGFAYKDDPAIVTTALINENDLYTHGNFRHHIPQPYRNIYLDGEKQWIKDNTSTYPPGTFDQKLLYKQKLTTDYFRYFGKFNKKNNPLRPYCGTNWMDFSSRLRLLASYKETDFTADHPYRHFLLDEGELNLFLPGSKHLSYLNLAKLWNKPLMHEEWTSNGLDRVATLSLATAVMTTQNHDATINFAMHHSFPASKPSSHIATYNMAHDPARAAILPALNLMFIRRDLKPNPRRITYLVDEKILFGNGPLSLNTKQDIRAIYPSYELASFIGQVSFITSQEEIPALLKRFPQTEIITPGVTPKNLPNAETYPLINGSGEIHLYWKERFYLITAHRTKMAMGYYGGKGPLDLGDGVTVNITTPGYICFALTSLSDEPIISSPQIMLTAFSHAEAKGTLYNEGWKDPILPDTDLVIKPIKGFVEFNSSQNDKTAVGRWYNQNNEPGSLIRFSTTSEKSTLALDGNGIVAQINMTTETSPIYSSTSGEE